MKISVFKNINTIETYIEFNRVVKAIKLGWFPDSLFAPSGVISVFDNKKNTLIYTGLVLMTFEADSDEELNRIFQGIIEMSTTYCCFKNHLGNGLNVLVKTDCLEGHHKTAYQQVVEAYKNYLGIEVSNYQPDEKILCQLSNDPNIFYNPDSRVFQIEFKTKRKLVTEAMLYELYKDSFDEQVTYTEQFVGLTQETWDIFFGTLSTNCFKIGIPMTLTLEFMVNRYKADKDVLSIVKRVYKKLLNRKVDVKDSVFSIYFKNFFQYKSNVETDKRIFFELLIFKSISLGIPFYYTDKTAKKEIGLKRSRLEKIGEDFEKLDFIKIYVDKENEEERFPKTYYHLKLQNLPQAAAEYMIDPSNFLKTIMPLLYQKDKTSNDYFPSS